MNRRKLLLQAFLIAAAGPAGASEQEARPEAKPKFAIDATTRKAMLALRAVVLKHHTLITHRRISNDGAKRFAEEIQALVDSAAGGVVLEGRERAALKAILAEIEGGALAIQHAPATMGAIDGMLRIDAALARYGAEFEDPAWQPLR